MNHRRFYPKATVISSISVGDIVDEISIEGKSIDLTPNSATVRDAPSII
jgi:hypothetical protein